MGLGESYYTPEELDSSFDWDFKSLQGNAVLRWEYNPGSTIFLVWQQDRSLFTNSNVRFNPIQGSLDTFKQNPINIFLLKFSYWLGS